jgi:hypothetical protein
MTALPLIGSKHLTTENHYKLGLGEEVLPTRIMWTKLVIKIAVIWLFRERKL